MNRSLVIYGRNRTVAGALILITAIVMFLIQGVLGPFLHLVFDIDKVAWALLVGGFYVLFGISLPDILAGRRSDKKEKEGTEGIEDD